MTIVYTAEQAIHDEITEALRRADQATDTRRKMFWQGVVSGYMAATSTSENALTALLLAQAQPFAVCAGITHVDNVLSMLPAESRHDAMWQASGVLYGYRAATAEEPGALECAACACRVWETDEATVRCDNHGAFCDTDCASTLCGAYCETDGSR